MATCWCRDRKTRKNGKTKILSYITFYNDSDQKITHTGRVQIGINHEKIFLKECDEGVGRKITGNGKIRRISIQRDFDKDFKNMSMYGSFNLQYSQTHGAWFIANSGRVANE